MSTPTKPTVFMSTPIRDLLLTEHSRAVTDECLRRISNDPAEFSILMDCFLSNEKIVAQRAAAVVGIAGEYWPHLLQPFLHQALPLLYRTDVHDALKRAVVRVLQDFPVRHEDIGEVANACFTVLMRPAEPIAIRAFAMSAILNLCKQEPDLGHELQLVVEAVLKEPEISAGLQNRANKVLVALSKNKK